MSVQPLTEPKSQGLHYVDNSHTYPADAAMAGELVLWKDDGVYPGGVPIVLASHPSLEGRIIVQGGNRTLLVSIVFGAKDMTDVTRALSGLPANAREDETLRRSKDFWVQQYRIDLGALINRVVMHQFNVQEGAPLSDISSLKLLTALARSEAADAAVIKVALEAAMRAPDTLNPEQWKLADEMASSLTAAIDTADKERKARSGE